MYQHRDVEEIEKQLNMNFGNTCDWFVDNNLSIHFGEDKTKSFFFARKRKIKSARKLNIKYKDVKIKQHSQVTFLGCIFDENLFGELMALRALKKYGKLQSLCHKKKFLTTTRQNIIQYSQLATF